MKFILSIVVSLLILPCIVSAAPSLEGQVTFAGRALKNTTTKPVSVWIQNENTKQLTKQFDFNYTPADSKFQINNLSPGKYGINFSVQLKGSSVATPGNYERFVVVKTPAVKPLAVELQKLIHLQTPHDNSKPLAELAFPALPNPLSFSWESIAPNTTYRVYIREARDPSHPNGYGYGRTVRSQMTKQTEYATSLPRIESNMHYEFKLDAYDATQRPIGTFRVMRADGKEGWDYQFKVR